MHYFQVMPRFNLTTKLSFFVKNGKRDNNHFEIETWSHIAGLSCDRQIIINEYSDKNLYYSWSNLFWQSKVKEHTISFYLCQNTSFH